MTGIIDVGGGLRGIFGAGVLDRFMELGISFDYCLGVSAGSANLITYLAKQIYRTKIFYTEYAVRPEYMSFQNLYKKGSYVDLDYVYGALSNSDGENPLDFDTFLQYDGIYKAVATDAKTGEALYFDKDYFEKDNYNVLKASCCLPVACKPVKVRDYSCFDGGVADPVPVKKALEDGCDRIVLILTRPADEIRQAGSDATAAKLLGLQYPEAAKRLADRYIRYNEGVALAKELEAHRKALILAPDDISGLKTLTKDMNKIDGLYQQGYRIADKITDFLK